jgi:hypothetical protein
MLTFRRSHATHAPYFALSHVSYPLPQTNHLSYLSNPTLNSHSWWMGGVGMCCLWWERIFSRTCPGVLSEKGGCEVEIGVLDFNLSPQCRPGNHLHYFILSLSLGNYSIQIQTSLTFHKAQIHNMLSRIQSAWPNMSIGYKPRLQSRVNHST